MAISKEQITKIIDLKTANLRIDKNDEDYLNNRDIAHEVLGSRSAESTVRRVWAVYLERGHYRGVTGSAPIASGTIHSPILDRKQAVGKKFVITSAQNNTFIHEDFFNSLLAYCEENEAQLIVSGFYYNRNGYQNGKRDDAWFDERILPYMVNHSLQLADGLVFCGELNILPTAVNPMSGLYNYTGDQSAIIPHAKMELESVPSHKYDDPKIMYTTGAITKRNYIPQKAGQKAEWHHAFSAAVVEIDDDGDWFVRHINAESATGCFYDLTERYTPQGKDTSEYYIDAIQYGDIHADKLRKSIADLCWGSQKGSIAFELEPKYAFLHDIHDHARRNHHNIKDPYYLFKQMNSGEECVEEEVRKTVDLLLDIKQTVEQVIVVESNHDLALERWLKEQDYRKDPVNALFFLKMQLANYEKMSRGEELQTFRTACEMVSSPEDLDRIRFLGTDEKFRLHGIECGQHGHNGSNGSRGSMQAFVKMGIKYNIGHTHSCAIKNGVFIAGACVLNEDAGYTKGAGSWSVSHIITYQNGKRAIITCKNGKWRA